MLGVFMATMLWRAVLFFVLAYWLYIERIMAAEEYFLELKLGNESRKWANTTPAFFPSFRNWSPSRYPVSIRNILRREYHGVLAVAFSMVLIEFVVDVGFQGQSLFLWAREDWLWLILLAALVALYLLLRALKKHTALLDNPLV